MNIKAIYALYPKVKSTLGDKCYDAEGNEVEIDIDLINSWVDPDAYKYQRASEYPSFADQFDLIYHDGIDAWKAAIQAVKDKYPKA